MTPRPATVLLRLAAVILLVGSWYPIRGLAADAPPAPPAVTVSQPIQRELVEWDEYTGQFAAKEYVEIRARVSGYLTEIHFEDGQLVKEGDLLFVIDPRPYEATLAAARAQLAQGEAQVELATRQLGRTAELRKKDFEPASTYDQRVSDLKVASAAVESAKAAIRSAELNVGFTRITAPLTGRISNHQVSIGNLISGGDAATTPALTTIVSLDPIYFYFDMSEGDYLAYQRATAAGMLIEARETTPPVYARLTDETEWPWKGQLNFLDNQVDRGAGTIRARATFVEPGLFPHSRAVRADPHPGLAAARRDPGSRRRRRHRSVAQDGDDREGGRHRRAKGRASRSDDRGRPAHHPLRPRTERPGHHQRAGAGAARRQGHAATGTDRDGGSALSGQPR